MKRPIPAAILTAVVVSAAYAIVYFLGALAFEVGQRQWDYLTWPDRCLEAGGWIERHATTQKYEDEAGWHTYEVDLCFGDTYPRQLITSRTVK